MKETERVGVGSFPTSFEEMPRLGAKLRGPRLFVKRDDMSGLFDMISRKEFSRDENVCFIHTGGTPALFAYKQHFQPGR